MKDEVLFHEVKTNTGAILHRAYKDYEGYRFIRYVGTAYKAGDEWVMKVDGPEILTDDNLYYMATFIKRLNTTICNNCGTGIHVTEESCIGCGLKRGEKIDC